MGFLTPGGLGHSAWVDSVWVGVLGGRLGSTEAGHGGNAEGEDGTHLDGRDDGDGDVDGC
jgi:hypothetical protein